MSDTIRQLMLERQSRQPIDLELAAKMGLVSPDQLDSFADDPDGSVASLYQALLGPSMTGGITDQYQDGSEQTVQNAMNTGDPNQLMRPMISSVVQLDR
jgi:hypothetical protein